MSTAPSSADQRQHTVLVHEHLAINFFTARDNCDSIFGWTLESLRRASHAGVEEVWDMSNQTLGRDLNALARLADLAGVSIVASTGHYLDRYHASETRDLSAADLARRWIRDLDIVVGSVRVGVVGEIATGREHATDSERKALEAAAIVQRETGLPIYTHTTYGTLAQWQLEVLISAGASAERVVIGHADVFHPIDALLDVASSGAYLGIDTVGKETWRGLDGRLYEVSDEHRIEIIRRLVDAHFDRQILLSSDLLYERGEVSLNPKTFGQHGYSYVSEVFLPQMNRSGMSQSVIRSVARDNALRLRERS